MKFYCWVITKRGRMAWKPNTENWEAARTAMFRTRKLANDFVKTNPFYKDYLPTKVMVTVKEL